MAKTYEKFGDDLLLNKLVLVDIYPEPFVEFILEHAENNMNDKEGWRGLFASVCYNGKQFGVSEDHIFLRISFRDDDPDIDGSEMYPGYRNTFEEGSLTTEIGGTEVRYREDSSTRFPYGFFTEFEYGGNIYFLDTFSKKNKNLSWDTLTNMLDPNKSEWLTLKEDVTLQNLPDNQDKIILGKRAVFIVCFVAIALMGLFLYASIFPSAAIKHM